MKLLIKDGKVRFIYDDRLHGLMGLGKAEIRRVSHVEPTPDGQWEANMVGGPILGPFPLRADALKAEIAWLDAHQLGAI
jgi:hypothetical protein